MSSSSSTSENGSFSPSVSTRSDSYTSSTPRDDFHIAIIGGGIAGACLAIGLKKFPNITVSIYEAADQLATIGAGLAIGPNASRALELIDPALGKAYMENATTSMWPEHSKTWFQFPWGMQGAGETKIVASPPNRTGQSTIHRAKFLDILVSLCPENTFHLGKRLSKIVDEGHDGSEPVTLHFADGSSAQADCVIGADGVKSSVREYVLPDAKFNPRFTGKAAYRGLVPIAQAESLIGAEYAQNAYNWIGKHGNIVTYPTDHGQMMNIVASSTRRYGDDGLEYEDGEVAENPQWPHKEWMVRKPYSELVLEFQDWTETVQKIVSLLDVPSTAAWSVWEHPPAPTYVKNHVTLLGDAAHAMTPYQGQGAAMAIEDALILSALLGNARSVREISQSLKVYDQVRRPRAEAVSKASKQMGRLLQGNLEGFGTDTKLIGEELEHRMGWIWDADLEGMVHKSVELLHQGRELRQ